MFSLQKYNLWGDPLLIILVPFVVAIAYLTGWLLLWIALKVSPEVVHEYQRKLHVTRFSHD